MWYWLWLFLPVWDTIKILQMVQSNIAKINYRAICVIVLLEENLYPFIQFDSMNAAETIVTQVLVATLIFNDLSYTRVYTVHHFFNTIHCGGYNLKLKYNN